MNWLSAILGAVVGASVAGGVVGMAMLVREKIVVSGAVAAEHDRGIVVCNARVWEIESKHNAAIEEAVGKARDAASGVTDPLAKADVIALCRASASCRDRGKI